MSHPPIKTIFFKNDYSFSDSPAPVLRQQIDTGDGFYELCCQYLHHSYSHFPEDIRFFHSSPLISRLILVEKGSVKLDLKDRSVEVMSGEIYLLPSQHPFYAEYRKGSITKGFHMYLRDHLCLTLGPELPDVLILNCPELFTALSFAIDSQNSSLIHVCMMSVIIRMLSKIIPKLKKRGEIPLCYQHLIEELKKEPSLALNCTSFARDLHISQSSLSKNFKRYTGISLKKYQSQLMLEKACKLLIESEMTANEVAAELGYSDLNYFFVFFKKHIGISPLAYRRSFKTSAEHR